MSTPLRVGQVVVTDPLPTGGGYVLLAFSPSVTPEEAQYLENYPAAGDALHVEPAPGKYYSFLRLPSRRWALTKRFASGKRRVSFNRIVVHTLVLSEEVLEAFAFEPWLLVANECLRYPGGAPRQLVDLETEVAHRDLKDLPDLEAIPPADPQSERASWWNTRRDILRQAKGWGETRLETELARIFTGLAARQGVLAAFDRESENLVHLAWSALPVAERSSLGWTTHLAPSVPGFHLALAPEEVVARERLTGPWPWVRRDDVRTSGETGQRMKDFAAWLVRYDQPIADLDLGYSQYGVRVLGAGENSLPSWLAWVEVNSKAIETATDPDRFEKLLIGIDTGRSIPPWLTERKGGLLQLAVRAVGSTPEGSRRVFRSLVARGLAQLVFEVRRIEGLAADSSIPLGQILVAVDLAGFAGRSEDETLPIYFRAFEERFDRDPASVTAADRIEYGLLCGSHVPDRAGRCAVILFEVKEGLSTALERLSPEHPGDRRLALALLRQAALRGEKENAEQVAKRLLLPWITSEQAATPPITESEQQKTEAHIAECLWLVDSATLAPLIRSWPPESLGPVLAKLPSWAKRDPARVQRFLTPQIVAHLLARSAKESFHLAHRLAEAGLPETLWARFAAAEVDALAAGLGESSQIHDLDALLGRQAPHGASRKAVADRLVARLVQSAATLNEGIRRLADRVAPEMVPQSKRIFQVWQPRFGDLAAQKDPMLDTLERLAEPGSEWAEELRRVRQQARVKQGGLIDEVAALAPTEWERPNWALAEMLAALGTPKQRFEAIGTLLGSPRLLPSTKRSIERHHLRPALADLGLRAATIDRTPASYEGSLFLSLLASQIGQSWRSDRDASLGFIGELCERERFWQIGKLLAGADRTFEDLVRWLSRSQRQLFEVLVARRELSYLDGTSRKL